VKKTQKEKIIDFVSEKKYFTISQVADKFYIDKDLAKVYLYNLKENDRIYNAGYKYYTTIKNEFKLLDNNRVNNIFYLLKKDFPYTEFTIWNTHQLQNLYLHTQQNHITFVDVEKVAKNSFYNRLINYYRSTIREKSEYDIYQNPVIVRELVSRAPKEKYKPGLAKILVDMYVDLDKHKYISKSEYIDIWNRLLFNYRLEIGTIISYAKRRRCFRSLFENIYDQIQLSDRDLIEWILNEDN
jgi:hypothetical protein